MTGKPETFESLQAENVAKVKAALAREGEPAGETLVDGQEEVFSRTEVERGDVEHKAEAGEKARPGVAAGAVDRGEP